MKKTSLKLTRDPNLSEVATAKLTQEIIGGRFKPGERLLEIDLANSLGVSRATLREAFKTLAGEGLLEIRQGRGSYVAKPSAEDMMQMVCLRALLEGAAARSLATEQNSVAFSELEDLVNEAEANFRLGNSRKFHLKIWEYHLRLMEAGRNRFCLQSWLSISNLFKVYISVLDSGKIRPTWVISNLRGFLEAMKHRSPSDAEEIVRSQIILMTFEFLARPITREAIGYVTYIVNEDGSVERLSPEEAAHKFQSAA